MTMKTVPAPVGVCSTSGRWAHRRTCMLAGGLAVLGGTLAFFVHPWFAVAAIVGGVWLILSPEVKVMVLANR